jgi:hypothetical protein
MAEREGFEPSVGLYTLHSLSRRAPSADSAISPRNSLARVYDFSYKPIALSLQFLSFFEPIVTHGFLAEGVGFEPTVRRKANNGFQDRRLQPLGHPSEKNFLKSQQLLPEQDSLRVQGFKGAGDRGEIFSALPSYPGILDPSAPCRAKDQTEVFA